MAFIDSTRHRRFSADKMQKLNLFETEQMFCDVYCLRSGQSQHAHTHAGATSQLADDHDSPRSLRRRKP